jgi:predicted DsbA family dithiol-disulfide isomerase
MSSKEDSLHLYIQIIEVLLNKNTMENKLKIQIWSDIMCPYCYIGKRRIDALEQFEHKAAVEIEWKSFQLDASFVASEDDDMVEHLATRNTKRQTVGTRNDGYDQNAKIQDWIFILKKRSWPIHLMRIACYIWQRNITYQIR